MKRLLGAAFLALVLPMFLLIPSACALVQPTERFYINDYADILSQDTEDYIYEHSVALFEATTAQIVVVTVPNLEGRDLESYSIDLARSFNIGNSEKDNGLLILLSIEERKSRIEVGSGLEGDLNDAKTGRIQDEYMIPYYKNDNFDEGMLNGYKAFYKEVSAIYNYETDVDPTAVEADDTESDLDNIVNEDAFTGLMSIGVFAPIIVSLFRRRKLKQKIISFIILESIILFFAFMMGGVGTAAWFMIVGFFTLISLIVCFSEGGSGSSGHGSWSSGGWSSGGSSGGGHSGGGGSFSGGGSSRSF